MKIKDLKEVNIMNVRENFVIILEWLRLRLRRSNLKLINGNYITGNDFDNKFEEMNII